MVVINEFSEYVWSYWLQNLFLQVKKACRTAYTEKAFNRQMQTWENQLNHIPHAKELRSSLIKCKKEDKYEFWAYIGDTQMLVAAISFQHVNDIAVLKGKEIIKYKKRATIALGQFARATRTHKR